MCLVRLLLRMLGVRETKAPPIDPDITYVTTALAWPEVEVERPWWAGPVEVHGTLYTGEGVTDVKAYLSSTTPCRECGKPMTERKVLARLAVDPACAEWRHVICP